MVTSPKRKPSSQWALLGDIEIEIITAPKSFSLTESAKFAEIEKISGKPSIQWTGDDLRTIDLQFIFNCAWCDPEVQLAELQTALRAHKSMQLTLGNGTIAGRYVLEEISGTVTRTDLQGRIISIEVSATLKEDAGEIKKPKRFTSPFRRR